MTRRPREHRISGSPFQFPGLDDTGHILAVPFRAPHDAHEPGQFVCSDGTVRLGVLADAGSSSTRIETMLAVVMG